MTYTAEQHREADAMPWPWNFEDRGPCPKCGLPEDKLDVSTIFDTPKTTRRQVDCPRCMRCICIGPSTTRAGKVRNEYRDANGVVACWYNPQRLVQCDHHDGCEEKVHVLCSKHHWRPMEEAPKGGQAVLAFWEGRYAIVHWGGEDWVEGDASLAPEPTHWQFIWPPG